MSFSTITSAQILTGEPAAQELFQKIKDDLDDHESRLAPVESSVNSFAPIRFSVSNYDTLTPATEVDIERMPFDITILGARILVVDAGISGTLECDVEYKRGAGAWTTLFSTTPSVPYTDGDYALSTNAVLAVTSLNLGDLIRLNITTPQVGNVQFLLFIDFERV